MKRVVVTLSLLASSIEAVQLQSSVQAGFDFGSMMNAVAPAIVQQVAPAVVQQAAPAIVKQVAPAVIQ